MSIMLRIVFMAAALLLAGCITSDQPLFADRPAALPLPGSFIMHGENNGDEQAWRIERSGDHYLWKQDKEDAIVRFHPVDGAGLRPGFHIATISNLEGGDLLYGLVEVSGNRLLVHFFDVDGHAARLGVPVENKRFSSWFASASDLMRLFAGVAADRPAEAPGEYEDGVGKARIARLDIYDLSVPGQRVAGEAIFARVQEAQRQSKE